MESSKPEDKKVVEDHATDAGASKDGTAAVEEKKDSKAEREKKKAERLAARQQKTQ
jgi:hypothetical protein